MGRFSSWLSFREEEQSSQQDPRKTWPGGRPPEPQHNPLQWDSDDSFVPPPPAAANTPPRPAAVTPHDLEKTIDFPAPVRPGTQPGHDHLVQRLVDFFDKNYYYLGGWDGVKELSKKNMNFGVLVKKSTNQLRSWMPDSNGGDGNAGGFYDADMEMDHLVSDLGDKLAKRMTDLGVKPNNQPTAAGSAGAKQAATQYGLRHGQATGQSDGQAPTGGYLNPEETDQRIKTLENKVEQLEKLIMQMRPQGTGTA